MSHEPGVRDGSLAQFCAEAGGVYEMTVWFPQDMLRAVASAMAGDENAHRYCKLVEWCLNNAARYPVCFCCGGKVQKPRPSAVVLICPHNDQAETVNSGIVCRGCARGGHEAVGKRAIAAWSEITNDPTVRRIEIHADAGRA